MGRGGLDPAQHCDTEFLERGGHELAGKRLLGAEQVRAGDDRHRGAKALIRGRHLDSDHAAADDREPPGRDLGTRGIPTRPGPDIRKARDVGKQRVGPDTHRDRVPGGVDSVVDSDLLLAGDSRVAAHERYSRRLDPLHLARVIPVAGETITAGEGGRHIQFAGHGLPRPTDSLRCAQHDAAAQQRLRRHAGPV